jgi:predicted dehydrogenase
MALEKVPVCVVGVGHLGRHHARLYAEDPDAELVAVVDSDKARAESIAADYGCVPLTELSAIPDRVRAASIAVPTVHHCRIAVQLLQSGRDVLVEKPLTKDLDEADRILEAASGNGRLVMVGHTERFNPAVAALAEVVDRPRFFEVHRLAAFSSRSTDIDVVLDLMIHDLDLLLHLDGTDPVSVDAVGVAALTDKVDIANARIRFASGCVANMTASRISAEPVRRIRVFQERTYLSCDTAIRKVERYTLVAGAGGRPEIRHDVLPVSEGEPLGNELKAFLEAVRHRTAPPVEGIHGRRAVQLAYQVLASIEASADAGR